MIKVPLAFLIVEDDTLLTFTLIALHTIYMIIVHHNKQTLQNPNNKQRTNDMHKQQMMHTIQ